MEVVNPLVEDNVDTTKLIGDEVVTQSKDEVVDEVKPVEEDEVKPVEEDEVKPVEEEVPPVLVLDEAPVVVAEDSPAESKLTFESVINDQVPVVHEDQPYERIPAECFTNTFDCTANPENRCCDFQ